ncbi:MAG TPA: acetoin utilization protein AcuC [Thermoplasmata archaeon]
MGRSVPTLRLRTDHPFTEASRWLGVRLIRAWRDADPQLPRPEWTSTVEPASRESLERFHAAEYLDLVERLDRRGRSELLDRGDTPSFPGCYDAAARIAGGTVTAARSVGDGPPRRALQPGGGLRHAHPGSASGLCIVNDVGVAIADALHRGPRRVAYVDLDVHHGDGVMYGFHGDGRVLDIDFHETGRSIFLGTGETRETGSGDGSGFKVNVPLPPGSGDEAFQPLFLRLVPPLIRGFRPELLVVQGGLDAHVGDGLGHLRYSAGSYVLAVRTLRDLADSIGPAGLVVTGGGGYSAANVALGIATHGAVLLGVDQPLESSPPLPDPWRREFEETLGEVAPTTLEPAVVGPPAGGEPPVVARLLDDLAQRLGRRFPANDGG